MLVLVLAFSHVWSRIASAFDKECGLRICAVRLKRWYHGFGIKEKISEAETATFNTPDSVLWNEWTVQYRDKPRTSFSLLSHVKFAGAKLVVKLVS